jgi:hypothetical protein
MQAEKEEIIVIIHQPTHNKLIFEFIEANQSAYITLNPINHKTMP